MSESKEQFLAKAYSELLFAKNYADHLSQQVMHREHRAFPKSMSDLVDELDSEVSSLKSDFSPSDYDDLLRYAAFVGIFKRESEDNLRELTALLIHYKRLLEMLDSEVTDSTLKDKIVAHMQDSNPLMGKLVDAGKAESDRQSAKRRSEIASGAAAAKIGKHLETKEAIREAYLGFLASGGKEKKRFVSEQAELHAKGESAIRSYITEWNKELKNQSA